MSITRTGGVSALSFLSLALALGTAQGAERQDPNRLGGDLTQAGAEKTATPDGAIPAWSGTPLQSGGWSYGKRRADHWAHKGDKPLYSIDASNVDKYAAKLNPGQVAVLKQVPGYRMEVYPSRRSCGMPDFVADNSKKNVGFAKIAADGNSLQDAYVPGLPFPIASTGLEVMWNAKMRYRGLGLELRGFGTYVSPRKGSSEWIKLASDMTYFYPAGAKGSTLFSKVDRTEGLVQFAYVSPAAMAGQGAVMNLTAGQPQETFYYFPGQRRVRRMPTYAYDAPQIGYDNQYTVDEVGVFTGPLDRFDWKLVGKQELLVPYNSFGVYDVGVKFADALQQDSLSPNSRRYEMHRVWVVEATVKSGVRHLAPKRVFYIDEDSWIILGGVDYDAQGKIWKVREAYPMPVAELGACDAPAFAQYNLADQRYLVDFSGIGASADFKWLVDGAGNPRMKRDFYTSENLRAISER